MINDIRIAPNELYGARTAFQLKNNNENTDFNQSIEMISLNENANKKENQNNKINFYSLGAPAGFFADISMLDENDAKEIGIIQFEND